MSGRHTFEQFDDGSRLNYGGFVLDQIPTTPMGKLLQRLANGDRIVLARLGAGYSWQGCDHPVPAQTVKALVNRQWVERPDLDLFGAPGSGRITARGWCALDRFNGRTTDRGLLP